MQLVLPLLYILLCCVMQHQINQDNSRHQLPPTSSHTLTVEPTPDDCPAADNQLSLLQNSLGNLITFY